MRKNQLSRQICRETESSILEMSRVLGLGKMIVEQDLNGEL
ncbi:hypothetical protein Q5O24_15405 [Eubacteriaceae bacterium ES3]|nr:hypothetical protein Q5O24_15405 [Eubacteriaceae bacterium ES3]